MRESARSMMLTILPLTLTFQKRIINSRGTNTTSATTAQRIGASKRCGLKENPRPPGEMPVLHRHSVVSLGGSECIQLVRMSQCQPTQIPTIITPDKIGRAHV